MAEKPTTTPASEAPHGTEETPSVEALLSKIEDLTRQSRKWEERSKENKRLLDEALASQAANLSSDEKAKADFAAATKRADEAEARADKAEQAVTRYRIAAKHHMSDEDADLLLHGDEATMTQQAERFSATRAPEPRSPEPNPAQGAGDAHVSSSTGEKFADAVEGFFTT